jgi:dipicolinate synthase subunit A
VCAAARSHDQRALAETMGLDTEGLDRLSDRLCAYDLVINTVPAPVLGRAELTAMKEGAPVIDLASRPGGVDFSAASALGVKAIHALALPGKEAPVTAGRDLRDTVYHLLESLV